MKVTLVLATTTTPLADAQPDFGFYRFKVTGQPDVDTAATTTEYDIDPGTACNATAQAFGADGTALAPPVMLDFNVPSVPPAPPAPAPAPRTFEAPQGLTVTFG